MPAAVRITDATTHGGTVVGPGEPTVLVGGIPAAVLGDNHACSLPPNVHQPTIGPFPAGSAKVLIGGKPALRLGDTSACGAIAAVGEPTVLIG